MKTDAEKLKEIRAVLYKPMFGFEKVARIEEILKDE